MDPNAHPADQHSEAPVELGELISSIEQHLSRAHELAEKHEAEIRATAEREAELARLEHETASRIEGIARQLHDHDRAMQRERSDLNTRIDDLTRAAEEAHARAESLQSHIDQLNHTCDALRAQADDARRHAEHLQEQLDQRPAPETVEHLRRELHDTRQQHAALEAHARAAEERAAALQAEVNSRPAREDLDRALRDVETALDQASSLEAQISRLNEDRARSEETIRELHARLDAATTPDDARILEQAADDARTRIAALEQLAEAAAAERVHAETELRKHAEDLAHTLDEARAERDDLQRQLQDAHAAAERQDQTPTPDTAHFDEEIAKRDLAIRTLHERLVELQSAPRPRATPDDARTTLRRDRLRRVRQRLHEQRLEADAMRKQAEARKKRLDDLQTELTGLERRLQAQQQRLRNAAPESDRPSATGSAPRTAGGVILALALVLVLVAGGSWVIAGRFAMPTFAVHTTLGMEGRESATPDALTSWENFHRAMLEDPQFLDDAAERMKRRGFEHLASPSDLRAFVESEMDIAFARPGEVSVALQARGHARSLRLMETFSTSYIAWSNAWRDRRLDNAALGVVSPITVDDAPIDDPRTPLFGAIFGALSALTLFAFLLLQRHYGNRIRRLEAIETEARRNEQMWASATLK